MLPLHIIETSSITTLEKELKHATEQRKDAIINHQVETLKDYRAYDDVMEVFAEIRRNGYYDAPLMLEWNTWRAMTMLDGGSIHANLKFDDEGQPLSTATEIWRILFVTMGIFS